MSESNVLKGLWGRFTARGGEAVEGRIRGVIAAVADAVRGAIDPSSYRAFVMLGGYGRGEGGVETIDGRECAHNNFDFLLIAESAAAADHAALKRRVDEAIQPLAKEHAIGMDASVTSVAKLEHSPCLVIWYDMRFGHKTILGDAAFVPGLKRYRVDRVLPHDVRNLLVNRGTLLVINDLLLERGSLNETERRTIVKHAVKGVIGYGDALLYFLGDYDWSYQEKQRRMRKRDDVDADFKALYEEAMEFRFRPHYEDYIDRDLFGWMADLRRRVEPVHLACERMRLNDAELGWDDYPDHAFVHALFEMPLSPRAWARKARNVMRGPKFTGSGAVRLGMRASGPRGVFPVLFPMIAYDLQAPRFRAMARRILEAESESSEDLRRAYLRAWGVHGDENFGAVLAKLGVTLERRAEVPA